MIGDLLGQLGKDGWGKFENTDSDLQAQRQRQRQVITEQAAIVAAVFDRPEGKRLLDMLEKQILLQPFTLPLAGKFTMDQQAMWAAFRQGQNDVVALILNAIAVARGSGPEIPKGEA